MAKKRSRQELAELDEAIDQLGGGATPLSPLLLPPRRKAHAKPRPKPRAKTKNARTARSRAGVRKK